MSDNNLLGQYLRARREQVTPESVGLSDSGNRRVTGLRRDELAMLGGISTEYYVRLEQGRDQNPSSQVLDALASALRLDEEATIHLHRLGRPIPPRRGPGRPQGPSGPAPDLSGLISSWPWTPAIVLGRLATVLAANPLGAALSPAYRPGTNLPRFTFLDPTARSLYRDWDGEAESAVAALRQLTGPAEAEQDIAEFVGELSRYSERFRTLWDRHDVRARTSGITVLDHPTAGLLELHYQKLAVLSAPGPCPGTPGQCLITFRAEPGSASEHGLAILARTLPDAGPYPPDAATASESPAFPLLPSAPTVPAAPAIPSFPASPSRA